MFRNALPDTYAKVLGFLEAQDGTQCVLYERCPHCPLVYCGRIMEEEQCPRCAKAGRTSPRYVGEGRSSRPAATLIYNSLSEYFKRLWRDPDLAS